jgi:hypothetical protein
VGRGRSPRAASPAREKDENGRAWESGRGPTPDRSDRAADAVVGIEGTDGAGQPHGRRVWLRRKR